MLRGLQTGRARPAGTLVPLRVLVQTARRVQQRVAQQRVTRIGERALQPALDDAPPEVIRRPGGTRRHRSAEDRVTRRLLVTTRAASALFVRYRSINKPCPRSLS